MNELERLKQLMQSDRNKTIDSLGSEISPAPLAPEMPATIEPQNQDPYDMLTKMRQPEDASQEQLRQQLLKEAVRKMIEARKQAPQSEEM